MPINKLPRGPFSIIYADPPWSYNNKASRAAADNHYPTMRLDELKRLPIEKIAADNSVLIMWHVPTMPREALALVEAWGFTFKTMKFFTWCKRNKVSDSWFMGLGNYTRANTEDALLAVRGTGLPKQNSAVRQLIESRIGRHSAKPEAARQRIVELYGDVPRIELFARESTPGWSAWGNQVEPNKGAAA